MRRAALVALAWGASAFVQADVLVVGEVGRSRSVSRDFADWPRHELPDWQPVIGQACGARYELLLVGTHRHNYLVIRATFDEAREFDAAAIRWAFGRAGESGEEQVPGFARRDVLAPVPVKAGDTLHAALPFTSKEDFGSADRVRVRLAFAGCAIESYFVRRDGLPARAETSSVWTKNQAAFALTAGVSKLGRFDAVADNGIGFALSYSRFPAMSHGFWLGFGFESLGTGGSAIALELLGGYAYRRYFGKRWAIHYEIGPGIFQYAYSRAGQTLKSLDYSPVVGQRFGLDWIFGRLNDGEWLDSDHGLGVGIAHDWLPGDVIGGSSSSGNALSFQLRYLFGT